MDEPLGALDKKLREEMQLEIKRIQSEFGITAIYVTHDQEEALVMSDRIAVMNWRPDRTSGHTRANLYERPRHPLRGRIHRRVEHHPRDLHHLDGQVPG